MNGIPNCISKKNPPVIGRQKKNPIPINININLNPGKLLFSNNVNKIASSYLAMGKQIQTNKNNRISKIHVKTNSLSNYNTRQKNVSNYILNNSKNNNDKSDFGYSNANNNSSVNYNQQGIKFNKRFNFSKERRQLSTSSNSNISNDLFGNGYKASINNSKIKIKKISSIIINNISKNTQNYSLRTKYLDSRNKTKKVPMKSRLAQFKNIKPIFISSFSNGRTTNRQKRDSYNKNINNCVRGDLFDKIDNLYGKNYNVINKDKNLVELKNKHYRHNTANFGQKELMNILQKRTLSNKNINNNMSNLFGNTINNIGNININNNFYINNDKNIDIKKIKNSINKSNINNKINSQIPNIINKINYSINSKNRSKRKNKINIKETRILFDEIKLKLKENKYNNSIQNNSNFYSNKHKNLNKNIPGVKKIIIKPREKKMTNKSKIGTCNQIPIPTLKEKNNEMPSERNIKLKIEKILKNSKNKNKNKNKITIDRKTISKNKKIKGNKSDFSLSQINKIKNICENKIENKRKNNDNQKNQEDNNKAKDIEINNLVDDIYISNLNKEIPEKNYYKKINNKNVSNKYQGKTDSNYSIDNTPDLKKIESIDNKIYVNKKDSTNNDIKKDNITTNNTKEDYQNEESEKTEEIKKIEKDYTNKEELKNNKIVNDLFNEDNLEDLPVDYDEDFNDLYSIINKINFGRVLVGVEGFFTYEGKAFKKYKEKFNKVYDKLYNKKRNSFSNSNNKKKELMDIGGIISNAKTNYSSSKKDIVTNI